MWRYLMSMFFGLVLLLFPSHIGGQKIYRLEMFYGKEMELWNGMTSRQSAYLSLLMLPIVSEYQLWQ